MVQLPVLSVLCLHLIAVGIAALVRLRGQKIEGRPAIEIVRVDDGKRAVYHALAAGSAWPVPHGLARQAASGVRFAGIRFTARNVTLLNRCFVR